MGGNSGPIIIQSVRAILEDPLIRGRVPAHMRAHCDAIMSKDEGDVTHKDVRFLLHCIGEAHDGC